MSMSSIAPDPAWARRDTALLAGLLALFLITRLIWVASLPESSQYWEEAYRWMAVHELRSGPVQPLLEYQADHYQGASLVGILLAFTLSGLVGDTVWAIKLAALVFSSATLVVLYALSRRFLGRDVAAIAALGYLAGPPLVAYWGVVLMGFHSESALASLLQLYAFLALLTGRWRGAPGWLVFGALGGLSFWFTPTAGLALAACALSWLLLRPPPGRRELLAAGVGLAVGLTPWAFYNLNYDFAGLRRLLEVFGARPSTDPWRIQSLAERATALLIRGPSEGLLDPAGDALSGAGRSAVLSGVLVPAGIAGLLALRRSAGVVRHARFSASGREVDEGACRELVFVVYGVVFAAAYLVSRFTFDVVPSPIAYRLLVPPAVLAMPLLAAGAARGLRAGGLRRSLALTACGSCLLCLAAATGAFALRHHEPGTPLELEAGYLVMGRLQHHKYPEDILRAATPRGRAPAQRDGVLSGIGWGLEDAYEQRGRLEDLATVLGRLPPEDRAQVEAGMGWAVQVRRAVLRDALARREDPDLRRTLNRVKRLAKWVKRRGRVRAAGADAAAPGGAAEPFEGP
jgi:hypothetical protein